MRTLLTCVLLLSTSALASAQTSGAVFTQTNDPMGNRVLAFTRSALGDLTLQATIATGGTGSGMGLGSQGSVSLSPTRRLLFVTNAGSNSISLLRLDAGGPVLIDVEPSQGILPTSVAERDGRVYVLNAGGTGQIAAYQLSELDNLIPLPGAPAALSSISAAAAQIGITPDGSYLICTERATNTIGFYPIAADGSLGAPQFLRSSGMTPFGFEFARGNNLIVSEAFGGMADLSAVSSYKLANVGLPQLVSASVPTTETAACWIANTLDGNYSYTTNTGSGTITGYRVMPDTGSLQVLHPGGVSGDLGAGANPLDAAVSADDQFLYVLSPMTAEIAVFRVQSSGDLSKLPSYTGVPATSFGLAAR